MPGPMQWKITGSVETTGLTDQGTPTTGRRISFELEDGTAGTVFVPDAGLNQGNVTALVGARATSLVMLKGLTGTVQGV
jgi:hypothetical protein